MEKYSFTIKDWPEQDRPRERLIKFGADKLQDAELLAILLRVGGKEDSAIDLARGLLNRFDGFRGLDSKSVSELCEINGIGPAKAAQVKAAIEIGKRMMVEKVKSKEKIETGEDVYRLVGPYMRDLPREEFKIILLSSRNNLILERTLFNGSLADSLVNPREIIKEALNHSAAAIIFVHNHPSGDPSPSTEDKRMTEKLVSACKLVGINPFDHIIIGNNRYYSFADHGLM
ncbi:DNA repair protein RadC [candidate division KSB1 bacterium]|nr:DNA repair protein RadC [candidate division KSB1 bacterium]MBL7092798.1 DNA repair protein RadC [candidate division KSB1 bacterium]